MAVYACSDLHGHMELYRQIKKFLKPEDKVYFLGDAGDRGPQSWELIQTIYHDPQFIYMKGNHEDMLAQAMYDFLFNDGFYDSYTDLINNGGFDTFDSWMMSSYDTQGVWVRRLNELPEQLTYKNVQGFTIILTHAGFTPGSSRAVDILWDRYHFDDPWPQYGCDNVIIIHGHTPIPYMKELNNNDAEIEPGAYWYCDNHKINIDNGTYDTGIACLLDLDTFDEHIFF